MLRYLVAITLAGASLVSAQEIASATSVVTIHYETEMPWVFDAALAWTSIHAWVATPGGLYRFSPDLALGDEEPFAFAGRGITRVYTHQGDLYLLKETWAMEGASDDHGLLRLSSDGASFVPLDEPLEWCYGTLCQYPAGSEARFVGDRIYYAAGGNLLVSPDSGESWKALVGFLEPAACYDPSFEVSGSSLLFGGECPLDMAWIRRATLSADGDALVGDPTEALTPYLENRNIQFIRQMPGSAIVFAGIEGAILRSTDGGASYEFVHRHVNGGANEGKYPYVGSLLAPSRTQGVLLAGGFDKAKAADAAWLAISLDGGTSWLDRSVALHQPDGFSPDTVSFLEEDSAGRILAGLVDLETSRLRIVELSVEPSRRRAVRRASGNEVP
ncbi:MAG: hypothetical protein ABR524_08105 [Thermoanaerobaculia bacterium]